MGHGEGSLKAIVLDNRAASFRVTHGADICDPKGITLVSTNILEVRASERECVRGRETEREIERERERESREA